ncbi:MAG: hypothetical protein IPP94_02850 [Ignavibacteria bacterium]|nr:hypothetical protein [Ignavibacteria bacterium]
MVLLVILCSLSQGSALQAQGTPKDGLPLVFDPARHARASNAAITVAVDRATGQYWVETKERVPILFNGNGGITSFTNVRVATTTFTNNDLHSAQSPLFTERMPFGSASEQTDRVVFTTRMRVKLREVQLTQEFLPGLDNDYAFVRIKSTIKNLSQEPLPIGLQLMYDLMIGKDDNPLVTIGGNAVTRESAWTGGGIPAQWEAQSPLSPLRVRARLSGSGTDVPSQLCVGRWAYNGYLGAAAWNYRPSGLAMWDDAVLMQWDQRDIAPGGEVTIVSDYGYLTRIEAQLACSAETLRLNASQDGYAPDPFLVTATVRNTGVLAIPSLTVSLTIPAGVTLDASETLVKTVSTPLAAGDSVRVSWRVRVGGSQSPRMLAFGTEITDPALIRQSCSVDVPVPALPDFGIALRCPDSIAVQLTPDGSAYAQDTFDAVASVTNTGTGTLTGVRATITIPAGILLVSGSATVPVVPSTLAPAGSGTATWRVQVTRQTDPKIFTLPVTVACDQRVADTCAWTVTAPAVKVESACAQNGVSTRGTEFWTAFPFNGGSDSKTLRVYISAIEESVVRIERPDIGRVDQITVPAGTVDHVDVEAAVEQQTPETVQKKSVRITSDKPVSVYTASLMVRHSDATMVLPLHALGRRHVVAGYNFQDPDEHFVVVATEDGTDVTIAPFSLTSTQRPPRQPFIVRLERGETYYVRSGITGVFGGLTGSTVDATKPVAVLSGSRTGWIPENTRDDFGFLNVHYDQVPPSELLGVEYAVVPFRSRLGGDTYKVVASEDSIDVTVGASAPVRLAQRGDHREFVLDAPAIVTATKPVLLAQFANSSMWDHETNEYGDASMVLLPPASRTAACHQFQTGILPVQAGITNQALFFDPGEWIQVPDTPQLASPMFTAECWFRAMSRFVLASRRRGAGQTNDWSLIFDYSLQRIEFLTSVDNKPDESYYTLPSSLRYGQYNHVACAVNGPAGTLRIYLNGLLALDTVFTPRTFAVSSGLAWGGYFNNANGSTGNGGVDECRYWTVERSGIDIRAAKDARLTPADRTGLAGYWSFCGGMTDSSASPHTTVVRGNPALVSAVELPDALDCAAVSAGARDFANLVVQDGAQGAVTADGVALPDTAFHRIGTSRFLAAQLELGSGVHRIETADPLGVGVTVYGFDSHDAYSMNSAYLTGAPHGVTGVRESIVPAGITLAAAPNPVVSETVIAYSLTAEADIDLALFDVSGARVATLGGGRTAAGPHRLLLRADGLASGAYIVLLRAGGRQRALHLTIVR